MKRIIASLLVAAVAVVAALGIGVSSAQATTCSITAGQPYRNFGANVRWTMTGCDGIGWTISVSMQAKVNGVWQQAANTFVATIANQSGNGTFFTGVGPQWGCVAGRSYRTKATKGTIQTDYSVPVVIC
jgi:hypothetical protein